jgi:hypothetical protein
MLTRKSVSKEIAGALLLVSAASGISCGSASAMSRSPTTEGTATSTLPAAISASITDPGSLSDGGFADGYQLGQRNGGILVARLKQRTVDADGCDAIDLLQTALIRVTRSVRPPSSSATEFVSGFYSGYVDSIRTTLGQIRGRCGVSEYSSGSFAGELYGAVACQVQTVSIDALLGLELRPLYSGWSGGSESVQSGCRTTLREVVQTCSGGGEISTSIDAAIRISCTDSLAI